MGFTYTPGKWTPWVEDTKACVRGYHFCRTALDLLDWPGPAIWECEVAGRVLPHGNKGVAQSLRIVRRLDEWNDHTARQFARDCAERVPQEAKAARIISIATDNPAWLAAFETASAAAEEVAREMAWSAARSAEDRDEPWPVESWRPSWEEVRKAAWNVERQWQANRLAQYLHGEGEKK